MTTAEVAKIYDQLAEVYDSRYADDTCLFENSVVQALVWKMVDLAVPPRLLDIGCGAGLALELELTTIERYVGIDPSAGMVHKLNEKFPEAWTHVATFEQWYDEVWEGRTAQQRESQNPYFDIAISLFGSPSYITPSYIEKILDVAPRVLMMHYKPGYWPDYEPEPVNSPGSREAAREAVLAAGGHVITFNNFWVSLVGGA